MDFLFPRGRNGQGGRGAISHFLFLFHFHSVGSSGGQIVIWTPLAKKMIFLSHHSSNWVDSLSFSPDGRFLASVDDDGKLIIWTIEVNKKNGTDKDGVAIT